jgi:hypothetical protein
MEEKSFIHKISKGSRFNQIYVPLEMSQVFELGDTVRVLLVKKKSELYFSKNIKLSKFKEKLISEVFSFLSKFKDIEQAFFVGSFINQKIDYRDIDLLIVTKKEDKKLESEIYNKLIDEFNLKFHLILISEEGMKRLSEICPLTRSMLFSYASNKRFKLPEGRIDKKHIEFLLMMPQDLLDISVGSRVIYDNIRRLLTIEGFLDKKEFGSERIDEEMKKILGNLYEICKNNENINESIVKKLREIIKGKLNRIKNKL